MTAALYLLSDEYRAAAEMLADLGMDEVTVADTLESISGDLTTKATSVVCMARNLESLAAQIKDAEAQMAARRKALEKRADSIRDYVLRCMQTAGIKSLETPLFRIAVRDNPVAVDVFDAAQVPSAYMRAPEPPPPAVDKTAVKAALAAGQDVPGCRLARGVRLDVK